jgi:hypothetical protein
LTQTPVAHRIGFYELHIEEINGLISSNLASLNEFKVFLVTKQSIAEPTHIPSVMHLTGWFSGQNLEGLT